ncbi:MAG: CxxC-x17-CxxC domain-containing protein [bacterium]
MYDKKMFQATCSKCGKSCEVPFKPTGSKPVLCSSCFEQQGDRFQGRSGGRDHGRSGDRGFGRSGDRQMYSATCDKCGKSCEVPFRPTSGKPIYCSECFNKEDRSGDRRGGVRHGGGDREGVGNKQISEQLKSLSNKLDKIIDLLDPGATKKESTTKEIITKPDSEKPEETKNIPKKANKKTVKKVAKKKK